MNNSPSENKWLFEACYEVRDSGIVFLGFFTVGSLLMAVEIWLIWLVLFMIGALNHPDWFSAMAFGATWLIIWISKRPEWLCHADNAISRPWLHDGV